MKLDPETLDRLRDLPPRTAYEEFKAAIYRSPEGVGSWDFVEGIDLLVDEGILTWGDVEEYEGGPLR